jgi:hypothetical protein
MCSPVIGLGIMLDCMTAHYIQVDLLKLVFYYNHDGHVFRWEHSTYADSRPRSATAVSVNAGFFAEIMLDGTAVFRQSGIRTLIYFSSLVSACLRMKLSCSSHDISRRQLTCARLCTLRQMMLRFVLQWFILGLLAGGPLFEWHTGESSLHKAKAGLR